MRFKEYIIEYKEIEFVGDLIMQKIIPLGNFLKKHNWIVTDKKLVDGLNKIFKDSIIGIVFKMSPGGKSIYRYIDGGELEIANGEINVYVYLNKGVSNFFKRFAKEEKEEKVFYDPRKNQFFSELLNMLSHEFRHIGQIKSSELKALMAGPDDPRYIAHKTEIDAFAYQAAIEWLKYGKGGQVYNMYKNLFDDRDNKVYKRFLKRMEIYKKKLKKLKIDKLLKVT